MPIISTITAGIGVVKTGIGIGKKLGIGGGGANDKGSSDLADTIDNYGAISRSMAESMIPGIERILLNGATNMDVLQYINDNDNHSVSVSERMKGQKWKILSKKLDQFRQNLQSQSTPVNQARDASKTAGLLSGNTGIFAGVGVGVLALIGVFLIAKK